MHCKARSRATAARRTMQPAELALRIILAGCRNRLSTPPKWSAGPTRRLSWCTSNGWATSAGHKGRRTGRQPATRGARRASRSLHSLLSQRPAHPTHRPGRARPRGPSRRRQAAVKVRNGRPDVPAGCLRAACRAGAACCRSLCCAAARCLSARGLLQRPHPCSNPVQSGSSRGVLGGAGGAACGIGRVQQRVLWSDLNGRVATSSYYGN